MFIKQSSLVFLLSLALSGCVASPKQITNRLGMSASTSLTMSEIKLLEKYNINTSEDFKFALTQTEKYGLQSNYRGVIALEKMKIEAKNNGVSLETYVAEQAQKKQEQQKKRNELLSKLKSNPKSDRSLNLEEPIYLSCSRISRRPVDGATTRSVSYVTLRNKTADYIEIYNKWNTRVAGQIDQRDSFFEKPISVSRFKIEIRKGGGDWRNNIAIDRRNLKLTHNEYLNYGSDKKVLYPNNVYSFNCDFSSPETIDWQKKTFQNYKKKISDAKKRREKKLQDDLKSRQF